MCVYVCLKCLVHLGPISDMYFKKKLKSLIVFMYKQNDISRFCEKNFTRALAFILSEIEEKLSSILQRNFFVNFILSFFYEKWKIYTKRNFDLNESSHCRVSRQEISDFKKRL